MTFVGAATDRRIPQRREEDVFLLVVNALLLGAAAEDAAADALANDDIFSSAFSFSRV